MIRNPRRAKLIQQLHQKSSRSLWQSTSYIALFFAVMGVSLFAWEAGWWPITLLCWALQAHIGHMNLIAFHESSHYTLHPHRLLNESAGLLVGSFILTPLSVYRLVHNQHHLHLGTERDVELWPFVHPGTPRGWRILAAIGELFFGFFYTPVVFLHGVLATPRVPLATRRRIAAEYGLCVLLWAVLLSSVAYFGVWKYFLIGYMAPSLISGNLQSLRKFTEHMGMLGHDVPSLTRTVVPNDLLGKILSESMMHIDYHGIHHRFAKIPHYKLPEATPHIYDDDEQRDAILPSYRLAMWEMICTLGDPRVGRQWLAEPADASSASMADGRSKPLPVSNDKLEAAAR